MVYIIKFGKQELCCSYQKCWCNGDERTYENICLKGLTSTDGMTAVGLILMIFWLKYQMK